MQTIENTTRTHPKSHSPLRDVIAFTSLTYVLVTLVALLLPHANINEAFNTLAPGVVVVVLTFTLFHRGTRRELWRSFGLRRAGVRTWGSALGVPLLLCGGAFGAALLVGAGSLQPLHVAGYTASSFAVNTVMNFAILVVFVLCEEIGFRGFVLPRVQQLTTKRRAAVVTGFLHALFHLPLILLATTYDATGSRWVAAPMAVLTITAAGVFYAWIWDRSGSAWAAAGAHAAANLTFAVGFTLVASTTTDSLAYVAGETGFATLAVVLVMAALLLTRAKVWQTPAPVATGHARRELVAAGR
jgi:membrane protease YdiL (CAAX protease family)